jgi:Phosducin
LNALEDEVEEDTLESFRAKRIAELKAQAAREKFGQIQQISKPDFVAQVTEASKDNDGTFVIVHLFVYAKPQCKLLNQHLARLAPRHKDVKFLKIIGNECMENYPEHMCPTLLIYYQGDIHTQMAGLGDFGGLKSTPDCVEWVLAKKGVLKTSQEVDPRIKVTRQNVRRGLAARAATAYDSDEVSSDEDDDF